MENIMKFYLQQLLIYKLIILSLFISIILFFPTICVAQNLLSGPQKIVIDAVRNRYLVSNYYTGDIVQIDSAGNQSYFVQGANFIDGLEIVGDTVYGVGNNRNVRAYDLATKQLVMNLTITGLNTNYLSSITSDSSGHLFISCPRLNIIYKLRISDQSYWVFAEANGLNGPNGILLEKEKNRIVVIDDSPSPSKINAISLADSTVSTLTTTTFTNPDGIERDKNGFYYVGGYYLPGIYKFDPDFSQPPVLFFQGSHIIYPTYNVKNHSLLITYYNANSWGEVFIPPTGIKNQVDFPKEFSLYQNYPNPFNPTTTFRFALPQAGNVSLEIYNSAGQLVRTLVSGSLEAGIHNIQWNATNDAGVRIASGIYLYKLQAGSHVQVKMMILLK
jgi:hypothetical protein